MELCCRVASFRASVRRHYVYMLLLLCLESVGSEVHFKQINSMSNYKKTHYGQQSSQNVAVSFYIWKLESYMTT